MTPSLKPLNKSIIGTRLTSVPMLTLPECTNVFVVYCDTSRVGLRCVLMHQGKVIAYASR